MAISNAQLAQKINELLNFFDIREEELDTWMNGTVGGGPNTDGTYPLTDRSGTISYVAAPAQLEDDVSGVVSSAETFKDDAETAQVASEAAQTAAELAETNAEAYRDTASGHATTASDHKTAAENAATNSNASMVKAEKWAEEVEDVEVETGQYSALHWAAKAASDGADTAADVIAAAASASAASDSADDAAASAIAAAAFDPALLDELFYGGVSAAKTFDRGLQVLSTIASSPYISLRNNSDVEVAEFGVTSSDQAIVYNAIVSGHVALKGANSLSATTTILDGDPDAGIDFNYAGVKRAAVGSDGLQVHDDGGGGGDAVLRFMENGSTQARLRYDVSANALQIRAQEHGSDLVFEAETALGSAIVMMTLNGDDGITTDQDFEMNGALMFGPSYGLKTRVGSYGSVQTNTVAGWGGYSIGGDAVFMWHGTSEYGGLYDDINNAWMLRAYNDGELEFYHAGLQVASTVSDGLVRYQQGNFIHHGSSSHGSGKITVSTSSPSGGSNGDIWFEV